MSEIKDIESAVSRAEIFGIDDDQLAKDLIEVIPFLIGTALAKTSNSRIALIAIIISLFAMEKCLRIDEESVSNANLFALLSYICDDFQATTDSYAQKLKEMISTTKQRNQKG